MINVTNIYTYTFIYIYIHICIYSFSVDRVQHRCDRFELRRDTFDLRPNKSRLAFGDFKFVEFSGVHDTI